METSQTMLKTLRPSRSSKCVFISVLQFFTLSSKNTLTTNSPEVVNLHHVVLKVDFCPLIRTCLNFLIFFFPHSFLQKRLIDTAGRI